MILDELEQERYTNKLLLIYILYGALNNFFLDIKLIGTSSQICTGAGLSWL